MVAELKIIVELWYIFTINIGVVGDDHMRVCELLSLVFFCLLIFWKKAFDTVRKKLCISKSM